MENKEITILGRPIALKARSKADMKGATIGDTLAFRFMDGEFHGVPLLFAEPKSTVPNRLLRKHAMRSEYRCSVRRVSSQISLRV